MIGSCAVMLAALFSVSLTTFAQDKKGLLAELPSKPGAHIEKNKLMGNNQWLNLGVPAADPNSGKARGDGRSFDVGERDWKLTARRANPRADRTRRRLRRAAQR
jgi:hypothetical protein